MKPDIAKLRQTILQLAVEGKLVPQDPSDEPAGELLRRIHAEKLTKASAHKIKSLPGIANDEMPFQLPVNWEWTRLGEVTTAINDGTHKTPKYEETGVKFLSIRNITKGYIDLENVKYISRNEHEELIRRCNPQRGDILFCRIGTLGHSKVIDVDEEFSIFVSLGLIKVPTQINEYYLEKVLNSPYMYEVFKKVRVGGLHTNKLNLRDMPMLPVALPPIAEQQRIVAKVDELMAMCDELEGKVDNFLGTLFKLRQTILQLALEGKLVPQDPADEVASEFLKQINTAKQKLLEQGIISKSKLLPAVSDTEKPFTVPDTWVWVHGQEVIELVRGVTYDKSEVKSEPSDGCVGLLRAGNVSQKGILDFDKLLYVPNRYVNDNQLIRKDDIMLVMSSGSKSHVGKAARSLKDTSYTFGTFNAVVRPILVAPRYMGYYFLSRLYRQQIEEFGRGVNIINLNKGKIDQLVLPLPPVKEQERIVARLDELMVLCDKLESKLKI